MKTIVVGGGKVGAHLARVLRRDRVPVVIIEREAERAAQLASDLDVLVLEGDGTDVRILEEADAGHASYLVAVTGRDEENLVACQLGRTAFGCERVLARVNNPKNQRTFEALDVPWVSVTDLLVQLIGQHMEVSDLTRIASLGDGSASVIEVDVPADRSPAAVAALGLPQSTVLAAIRRGRELLIPDGSEFIRPGDKVIAVTLVDNEEAVRSVIRAEYGT